VGTWLDASAVHPVKPWLERRSQRNQPDQQAAYYYDWGGQPWKTQKLSRTILALMYGSDKSGYAFPGMDDQGSTASWYVMSALGFYPVDPSNLRPRDHPHGQRKGPEDPRAE
jgi:putative alpha-1,2-mannosidase